MPAIWNFVGAYPVLFMVGAACSTGVYTAFHFLRHNPEVEWRMEMRHDELKENPYTARRAEEHVRTSFFRKVAMLRDHTAPGGYNDKDTRIFKV